MQPLATTPSLPRMTGPMLAGLLLAVLVPAAHAQQEASADRAVAAVEAAAPAAVTAQGDGSATPSAQAARRIDVGAATGQLLAMQRSAQGQRPRPIDGEQASRSYQRYLKSFETSIPEHYETGIDAGSGGSR